MDNVNNISKKKHTKFEELTKEQIRRAIIKKHECNTKAQQIVERLLEKCIDQEYLLKCLSDINQNHFEDVIEERSIMHLCGYPLCQKTIFEKDIPKQKYRISTKNNKVYDITARKSFCSNICFKSAMYIKKQMLTSPLWFREYEEIPKFHILTVDTVGSLGQEIDLSLTEKIKINSESRSFTCINEFTSVRLSELQNEHLGEKLSCQKPTQDKISSDNSQYQLNAEEYQTHLLADKAMEHLKITPTTNQIKNDKNDQLKKPNPLNIVGEIIEKPEKKLDPILTTTQTTKKEDKLKSPESKKLCSKYQPSVTTIIIEVEKCLAEWFTLDTLLFLFGEEKVRELVKDKGPSINKYLNNQAQSIFYRSNSYDQYQELCRKLNMLELEDKKYDAQTLAKKMKPLPDYRMLKEESKKLQLKVKAYFSGETEIPDYDTTTNIKTPCTIDDDNVTPSTIDDENVTQLPLVDKNSQNALRRRIVCQHLNKVLPDLLSSLGLLTLSISAHIRLLVNTFELKPNNIMFKPVQWTLIAIIFIKLLSLRDGRLEYLLKQQTAFQHMQLLLLSYNQDGGYLDRLILWLTNVDRLLNVSDKQLTIETSPN